MYAVRGVMENIESMEKSGENEKNCSGQGNSLSANLKCLNFEIFWRHAPKGFTTCSKKFTLEQRKVMEMSGNSLENFCIHPDIPYDPSNSWHFLEFFRTIQTVDHSLLIESQSHKQPALCMLHSGGE